MQCNSLGQDARLMIKIEVGVRDLFESFVLLIAHVSRQLSDEKRFASA